jgi:hypothetical protein
MTRTVYDVVADFGADPTGATSSDVAFRNFSAAVKSGGLQPGLGAGVQGCEGIIPDGTYVGINSYDLTKSNGFIIKAEGNYGAVLYADGQTGSSKPVFDMTGSNGSMIQGVTVYAMDQGGNRPAVLPSCAILMAASSAMDDSNRNKISGGGSAGFFASAPLCMIGTTDNEIEFHAMVQQNGNLPCLNHSCNPDWYINSPYVAITLGNSNCGENTFEQVEIHSRNNVGGWASYFRNAYSVRFQAGNQSMGAGHGAALTLFQGLGNRSILCEGVQYWTESGPTPPDHLFQTTDGPVSRLICEGCDETGAYSGSRLNGSFPGFVWQ